MDTARFDQTVQNLAQATGRRSAMRSLGASGLALLAALGFADASAKDSHKGDQDRVQADGKRKNRRKKKRGSAGPSGPPGLAEFTTTLVVSESSEPLGTVAGKSVLAIAECGGAGKVVSCGHAIIGVPAERLVNALVSQVRPDAEHAKCSAFLLRTAEAGSIAGATIQATAICLA